MSGPGLGGEGLRQLTAWWRGSAWTWQPCRPPSPCEGPAGQVSVPRGGASAACGGGRGSRAVRHCKGVTDVGCVPGEDKPSLNFPGPPLSGPQPLAPLPCAQPHAGQQQKRCATVQSGRAPGLAPDGPLRHPGTSGSRQAPQGSHHAAESPPCIEHPARGLRVPSTWGPAGVSHRVAEEDEGLLVPGCGVQGMGSAPCRGPSSCQK